MRKLKSFLLLSLALIILPTFPILLIAPTKASAATNPVPWAIKTIAGGPGSGQATSVAQKPVNVIASGSNLIVGDVSQAVIREINPNGYESVIAGNGIGGYYGDGGPAVNAEIGAVGALKDPKTGNLLIPSGMSCRLRLVAATSGTYFGVAMTQGDIYTIAGNGVTGSNGSCVNSSNGVLGVDASISPAIYGSAAFDLYGNIVFDNTTYGQPCSIDVLASSTGTFYGISMTEGYVYTIMSGTSSCNFTAIDSFGNLLTTYDYNVSVIAESTGTFYGISMTKGNAYNIAGVAGTCGYSGSGIPAITATICANSIAFDKSGNIIVSNGGSTDRIMVIAESTGTFYGINMTQGDIYTIAGNGANNGETGDGGPALSASLYPGSITVDNSGNIIFCDASGSLRLIAESTGTFYGISMVKGNIYLIAGGPQGQDLPINGDVTTQGNNLLVSTQYPSMVRQVSLNGQTTNLNASTSGHPDAIAVDNANGNELISYPGSCSVSFYATVAGTYFGMSVSAGGSPTIVNDGPYSDTMTYPEPTSCGYYGGDGTDASSYGNTVTISPGSVAFDSYGNALITDYCKVRIVANNTGDYYGISMQAGYIYTLAGNGNCGYSGNASPAIDATLGYYPHITVDANGNILLADGNTIRVIAASTGTFYNTFMIQGNIYTVAGIQQGGYLGDGGPAISAELWYPQDVIVDTNGNLVISDYNNNRIRVVAESTGTFYGINMTQGNIYTIAGTGKQGFISEGDGSPGVDANFTPETISFDSAGNLAVTTNDALRVIAESTGTFYGINMTQGDIYTVLNFGEASLPYSNYGFSGMGGPAVDAEIATVNFSLPTYYGSTNGLQIDSWGNLLFHYPISPPGYGVIIPQSTGTYYGIPMTKGNIYQQNWNFGNGAYPGDGQLPLSPAFYGVGTFQFIDPYHNVVFLNNQGLVSVYANSNGTFYGINMTKGESYVVAGATGTGSGSSSIGGPATQAYLTNVQPFGVDKYGNLLMLANIWNGFGYTGCILAVAGSNGIYYGQNMIGGDIYCTYQLTANDGSEVPIIDKYGNFLINGATINVLANSTGTYYGINMVAGNTYTIAGNGESGDSGDGGPATQASIDCSGEAIDPNGNIVFMSDNGVNGSTIRVVAESTGTFYGINMTQGDIYTIAGNGTEIPSGDGGPALDAGLGPNVSNVVINAKGDIFFEDGVRIREIFPSTPPSAPTNVIATATNSQATVSWIPPSDNGGSPITSYTITPYIGTVAQSPVIVSGSNLTASANVTGLTNGQTYAFEVAATNSIGTGSQSQLSNSVVPDPPPNEYFPMTPTRIVDTRVNSGYFGSNNTLGPNSTFSVDLSGNYSIPTNATAVSVNVTVTNTTSSGYLTVYPDGLSLPTTSNLNWQQGDTKANLVEVNIGTDGKVDFYNRFGSTDLVVDLEGYYVPSYSQSGLYSPISPTRICDTRVTGNQCSNMTLGAGQSLVVQIAGTNNIPLNAQAAVINLTATNTTAYSFLSVSPDSTTNTSALNWESSGYTASNRVIATLSATGSIVITNAFGSTDVIVDLSGYFSGSGASSFTGINPIRVLDTRPNSGYMDQNMTLGPGSSLALKIAGTNTVPANATAAVINVTATDTLGWGYLTISPTGINSTSDLNWIGQNESVANLDIATLSPNGYIIITNGSATSVDVVIDLFGYFS